MKAERAQAIIWDAARMKSDSSPRGRAQGFTWQDSDRGRHQRQRLRTTFRHVEFGEDDANLEFEIALRLQTQPVFIKAFYEHPQIDFNAFNSGLKYLITGQKGTGKTAILRKLSSDLSMNGA